MTKITIFSGFLGAGKTTLIKKLIAEGYKGEKLVLIENEFGQIGIDGGFLQDAGVEITEMNSGCICCSLVGDFGKALEKVLADYAPDRILIEPSGVGKLSDVIRAVQDIDSHDIILDGFTTVVDAKKCRMYRKNFGEFFNNQITYASCIILSHTQGVSEEKLDECIALVRELNPVAPIVTTDWDELTGVQLVDAITQKNTLDDELKELLEETGCVCSEYTYLGEMLPTPAYNSEITHIYLAKGLSFEKQQLDTDEFLDVEKIPLSAAVQQVMDGTITDGKTQIAILKAARILGI